MPLQDEMITQLFFDIVTLDRRYSSQLKQENPHRGQIRCLLFLYHYGTVSQKELAQRMAIRSTSLSELLTKLETKDLITRSQSSEDKRTMLVSLTEEGYGVAEKYEKLRLKEHSAMLGSLTSEEKQQFYDLLEKIQTHYHTLLP